MILSDLNLGISTLHYSELKQLFKISLALKQYTVPDILRYHRMIIIFLLRPFWRTLVKLSQISVPRKYISKQTSKQSAKINVPRASCSKKRFQTKTRFETQAKPFFPYQIAAPSKFVLIAPKHRNGTSKFDRLLCLEYLG